MNVRRSNWTIHFLSYSSLLVGGNVRLGYVRLGRRIGKVQHHFLKIKKIIMKTKLWSMTIISRMIAHVPNLGIIPPKFLWAFHHSFNEPWPQKKFFFDPKKKIFDPIFLNFFILNLLFKFHRNYGDIMPGFGTWSKSIVFMVKTFAV